MKLLLRCTQHKPKQTYTHTKTHTNKHTHTCTHTCTHICTCTHTCTHKYTNAYSCIYTYTHGHKHTPPTISQLVILLSSPRSVRGYPGIQWQHYINWHVQTSTCQRQSRRPAFYSLLSYRRREYNIASASMKQFLFSLQKSLHAHQELLLPASAEVGCAKFICFLARRPFVGVHHVVALGL